MAPHWITISKSLPFFFVEIQQIAGQNQMAGARNRQKLGDSFDDAKDQGLDQKRQFHELLAKIKKWR